METKKKYLLFILLIGALLFLYNLGGRDLWDPDETRYAVVAREMRESGNWILPHLAGTPYLEKPPLFFWLVNLSTFSLRGDTAFANRFPSAFAGLLTTLMVFVIGYRLFDPMTGLLSGLILATSFFFLQISRWMMLDSLFSFFFLSTVYFLYRGMNEIGKQRTHFLLAGVFMACATLTKGPIGYLPIPIFLIYSLINKEFRKIWNRNLLYGAFLSIALVLAWLFPAMGMAGQQPYDIQNVWHQTIGRFAAGWKHQQAIYFYFIRFPFVFIPWIIFLPWAFGYSISGIEKGKRKEFLLLFVWFAFIFLFFSLSKGKKDNYLLPLYPAAALMVGKWMNSFLGPPEEIIRTYGKLWMPIGIATLLFITFSFLVLFGVPKLFQKGIDVYLDVGIFPLAAMGLGGIISILFLVKKWNLQAIFCFIAALVIAQLYLGIAIPHRFNALRSMKPFAQKILSKISQGDELKIWKFQSTGLLYYTKRPVEQVKTKDRLLEVYYLPRPVFMVVEEEDLSRLQKEVKDISFHPIEKARVGHQTLLLVSNQAAEQGVK